METTFVLSIVRVDWMWRYVTGETRANRTESARARAGVLVGDVPGRLHQEFSSSYRFVLLSIVQWITHVPFFSFLSYFSCCWRKMYYHVSPSDRYTLTKALWDTITFLFFLDDYSFWISLDATHKRKNSHLPFELNATGVLLTNKKKSGGHGNWQVKFENARAQLICANPGIDRRV